MIFLVGIIRGVSSWINYKILRKEPDFASKVIRRYQQNKPLSPLAISFFENETAETINRRFALAKQNASKFGAPGRTRTCNDPFRRRMP